MRIQTASWSNCVNHVVTHSPGLVAGLILPLAAAGCANHNPRPLSIQSPPAALRQTTTAREQIELKLATFNVWGLPAWINGASPERFLRIARELETAAPDFAVLQEVWTRRAQASAPAGTNWWIARAAQSQSVFRRCGLVTASRHPIVGGEFHPFRCARLPDAIVSKGALKTTIELEPGLRVNLWNVHLQAGESASAERARCRQIDELAAWVRNAEDGQIADLVAGDFNCEPGTLPYQRLQETIGAGALELGGRNAFCTYDGMKPGGHEHLALDHVLIRLRQPMQTVQASPEVAFASDRVEDRLSDHFGVMVGLSLTASMSPAAGWQAELLASRRPLPAIPAPALAAPLRSYPGGLTAHSSFLLR